MNTTTHPVAPEEIMALLDEELTSAEAKAVTEHIEHCAECAALRADLRETSNALNGWKVPAVSAKVERAVEARVAETATARKAARPRAYTPLSFRNWKLWAIGGSGAVAAVLGLIVLSVSFIYFEDHFDYRGVRKMAMVAPERSPAAENAVESYGYADTVASTPRQAGVAGMDSYAATNSLQSPSAAVDSRLRAESVNGPLKGKLPRLGGVIGGVVPQGASNATVPMIARTMSLTILVKNIEAARKELDGILAQHQGYAAQLAVNTPENGARSFQSSLRIPAGDLVAALAGLRKLGRVQTETQSGEEVTQQHTDLLARLTNARETEARLRGILQQRTGKMQDVLDVEERISETRGEIEQMEAEQKTLEHRVDFATVDLQLTEEYKAQLGGASVSVGTQMRNAFVAGIEHAGESLVGLILFLEEYGPPLLLWCVIIGVPVWLLWRRARRKRTSGY
jgi:hypothetical protein